MLHVDRLLDQFQVVLDIKWCHDRELLTSAKLPKAKSREILNVK